MSALSFVAAHPFDSERVFRTVYFPPAAEWDRRTTDRPLLPLLSPSFPPE